MKILFDNGTPKPIARCLTGHEVTYARRIGWHELENGELIQRAEEAGYDVLLSTDKNIRYQQNLSDRKIALVVLGNQQWPAVRLYLDRIAAAVNAATPGSFAEVDIPLRVKPGQILGQPIPVTLRPVSSLAGLPNLGRFGYLIFFRYQVMIKTLRRQLLARNQRLRLDLYVV
jgi:hypothetical protein